MCDQVSAIYRLSSHSFFLSHIQLFYSKPTMNAFDAPEQEIFNSAMLSALHSAAAGRVSVRCLVSGGGYSLIMIPRSPRPSHIIGVLMIFFNLVFLC